MFLCQKPKQKYSGPNNPLITIRVIAVNGSENATRIIFSIITVGLKLKKNPIPIKS